MKFYCDNCVKHADGFKGLLQMLNEKFESIDSRLKTFDSIDIGIKKSAVEALRQASWSDVVKSNSKIVDNEAASLRNQYFIYRCVKARENNIVLFNFSEDLDVAKDRGNVLGFLRSLTDESLKDDDILKIFRQDICILTETWHGSSDDISVKLAMPQDF
ncbi:hypothetical protein HELRODRAFT_162703 [Helobdella robusta]|uniref:Uncharacterized protein n=1 Tax=Helobdella robusta TaxID=6412 RepID=T1ET10_HELRO|nr:hypothetical protein HELRODRAFT_162703 [Helobdella robusta]ESN99195.1 hypothetical protein HELRODRAFT_162703 [Helobdella robusta]